MSFKSDIAMLTSLGTPENWTLNEGCVHVQPYQNGHDDDATRANRGTEFNNNRYGPRWMGWADE